MLSYIDKMDHTYSALVVVGVALIVHRVLLDQTPAHVYQCNLLVPLFACMTVLDWTNNNPRNLLAPMFACMASLDWTHNLCNVLVPLLAYMTLLGEIRSPRCDTAVASPMHFAVLSEALTSRVSIPVCDCIVAQ